MATMATVMVTVMATVTEVMEMKVLASVTKYWRCLNLDARVEH